MRSTADKVLEVMLHLKKGRGGSFRGSSPFRPGSDSNAFVLTIHDGEHGAYKDFAREGLEGSLYDLAAELQIETPKDRVQVENSKRAYEGLADYALRHYSTLESFAAAKWREEIIYGRPALVYPVQSGTRVRFIDEKGGYSWIGDNTGNCWYGLSRARTLAYEAALPLVLCNGEASTIAALAKGVPAFAGVGGEGAINEAMLEQLVREWKGQVLIAFDCDEKGREAATAIQPKIPNSLIVDLGLSEKGDLADFIGLHDSLAMNALKRIASKQTNEAKESIAEFIDFVSSNELLSRFHEFVWEAPELFGRVIKMPFASLRQTGGFAELMTTKKIWLIGNVSGGGKTILSETLCDGWNELGYNVLYIGDEWTAMELTGRRIQRANPSQHPLSYMDYLRYVDGSREFTDSELSSLSLGIRRLRSYTGQTFYMQTSEMFHGVVFLEDIMEAVARKIDILKPVGLRIDIIVLDYLSLYETRGKANNLEEYKAGIFKSYCKSLDVLGVTTSQVNKDAEERVIHKGGFLNQNDLFWMRADKGNLISTMNRIYKPRIQVEIAENLDRKDWYKPYINENGQPEPTDNFTIVTVKNSVSNPFDYAYFHFDFTHMKVCEGLHPDYYFDKQEGAVLPNSMHSFRQEDL
jgi:hypothetical protein